MALSVFLFPQLKHYLIRMKWGNFGVIVSLPLLEVQLYISKTPGIVKIPGV